MAFHENALICTLKIEKKKEVKSINQLINHDCLHILMLFCIVLYMMLAYLMLFAAISNAVCLHNVFFAIYFCKCFCFHALCRFIDT